MECSFVSNKLMQNRRNFGLDWQLNLYMGLFKRAPSLTARKSCKQRDILHICHSLSNKIGR